MTRPRRWRWWGKWMAAAITTLFMATWCASGSWRVELGAVRIPILALFLPLAAYATWLWRLDRKTEPGHCPRCHYDLTGIPSGRCPECGRIAEPTL